MLQHSLTEIIDDDLHYVLATAADLKDFLLGDTIYWSLSNAGHADYYLPKGTLGGLMVRLHRLEGLEGELTPEQADQLHEARQTIEAEIKRWTVQAEVIALRESKVRIQTWLRYVEELEEHPHRNAPEYPTQARGRTALAFLIPYVEPDTRAGFVGQLATADHLLRSLPTKEEFVWSSGLRQVYSERDFWWLYLKPLPEEKK